MATKEKQGYRVTRKITVPLSKLMLGEPMPVKFAGEEPRSVQIDAKPDKDGKVKAPATVLRCTRMDTGEVVDLIASTVMLSQLEREYGGISTALAGKCVLFENTGKRAGKGYNDVVMSEIEEN